MHDQIKSGLIEQMTWPGRAKNTLRGNLTADVYRVMGRSSLWGVLRMALFSRTFRSVVTMRLCQATKGNILCRVLHYWAQGKAGLDLPWNVEVGRGLLIAHGWGLVVSAHAKIGSNVTLLHGVTIGGKEEIRPDGSRSSSFPTIQDEVWMGAHSIVIGGITIGQGAIIAPGAVVTRDVPPRTIMAGVPARVIRNDAIPDVRNKVPF
jgi:serine O-acetyltransferase